MTAIMYGADDRMFAPVPIAVQTTAYAALANSFVPCNTTGAGFTVTLPAAPVDRAVVAVKLVAGTNTVTIAAAGTDVFDVAGGSTSITLTALDQATFLQYSAAAGIWYQVANYSTGGGGGAVSSVFGRTGAVAAAANDYAFSQISGTATIAQGGTGQVTQQAAINALTGTQSAAKVLRSDGTNATLAAIQASDVPTLNQSTTGTAAGFTGALVGDVTGTQGATAVGKVQGVAITSGQATIVSNLTNGSTRSATATLNPGEETIFTGSTGSQTLTLPVTPTASTVNTVTNTATVSVTLAPGAGATISNFGTSGNITIPAGYTFVLVYIGTTWYVQSAGPSDFAKNSALAITNGGTGSSTQNFVDLTTGQNVGGIKTFTSRPVLPAPPSYSAFAPVTSTGSTTVTGVTALTVLASGLTVPASGLAAGQVYSFKAWGALTTTLAAQTVNFALYWGGIAGTLLLSWGAQQPNSGGTETGASWTTQFDIVANSATSIAVIGWSGLAYFFNNQTNQTTTVANSSSEQLVLGLTPSATAVSVTCSGFSCVRVA